MVGMPTVVEKGVIFDRFATYYNDPEWGPARRLEMLVVLRTAMAKPPNQRVLEAFQQGGAATGLITNVLPAGGSATGWTEWVHVLSDWLGAGRGQTSFFRAIRAPMVTGPGGRRVYQVGGMAQITAVSGAEAQAGLETIVTGVIELLEVSLGLQSADWDAGANAYRIDGQPVTIVGSELQPAARAERFIEIVWVCGKLDGFEAMVTWEPGNATLYIVTPPINTAVYPLSAKSRVLNAPPTAPLGPPANTRDVAKTSPAGRGVLLVRRSEGLQAVPGGAITSELMHRDDGGVSR